MRLTQLVAQHERGERHKTHTRQRREGFLKAGACGCSDGNAPISYQDARYDAAAAPFKRALLAQLLPLDHEATPATIVEIGVGGFSNAALYPRLAAPLLVIGIEPDVSKHESALAAARDAGLSLSVVKASAEALPLEDSSVDAVVTACTLCTVKDPRKALQEVRRVLKPGGRLLFWEHVLSETEPELAKRQIEATPQEVALWGCHFDRRTLEEIQVAGFAKIVGIEAQALGIATDSSDEKRCYFELPDLDLMGPTALGIAVN